MSITARDLLAAAASVEGSRSLGIETEASRRAPALLAAAEAAINGFDADEPSAPSQHAEARYASAVRQIAALAAAADELRAALGMPLLQQQRRNQARGSESAPAAPAAETDVTGDERFAADFAAALPDTDRRYGGPLFDQHGQRVARVERAQYAEWRTSSLTGEFSGGDEYGRHAVHVSAAGRELAPREWVSGADGERQLVGDKLMMAGMNGVAMSSASSDWLPCTRPAAVYRSDYEAAQAWDAAFTARREARAADKSATSESSVVATSGGAFASLAALMRSAA